MRAFDTHAMSHVAWSAGDNHKSCAETAEPIEMPLGMLTRVSPRNRVLDRVYNSPREEALLTEADADPF